MTTPTRTAVQGTANPQRTHPSPWKQTGNPLNQSKVTKYQPPDKGPSTLSTAQKRTVYEQEHQTKVHHLCGTYDRRNRLRICAGKRHRGHQRSHLYGEFVFRPRHETYLRHRRGGRSYRGRKSVWQILVRRSGHLEDRRKLVRGLHFPDCRRHYPAFILPLINNVWLNTR